MKQTTVRKTKPGEYVRLADNKKAPVWVRCKYDRAYGKYELQRFDDINHRVACTGDRKVFVGFTF